MGNYARRPDNREQESLSEKDLKDVRYNLAHLSLPAVREFYERDFRLIYNRIPTPKQRQTLVQVWKQLWKWRSPVNECNRLFTSFIIPQQRRHFHERRRGRTNPYPHRR